MATIFTLAPADHETDVLKLERTCYKVWSTYRRDKNAIDVRTNNENAGGQVWARIASKDKNGWTVEAGRGLLQQGGALLARYLVDSGNNVACDAGFHPTAVKRYAATMKRYSLPSILNRGEVLSRDGEADKRSKERKGVDMAEAMKALQAKRAAEAAQKEGAK